MKLPLKCGHWDWTVKDGTKFIAGAKNSEGYGAVYEGVVDADGETMLEYAGCGSHQIEIHPDLVALIESPKPDKDKERDALLWISNEAHVDCCPWFIDEACDCHVGVASAALGIQVDPL